MSRLIGLLAVLSLHPLALDAQSAAQWRETARKAETEYRALRDSMLQGDSSVQEVSRKDNLVLGASAGLQTISRAAFDRLTKARDRWFSGAATFPNGFRIVLREDSGDPADLRRHGTVVLSELPDSGNALRMDRTTRHSQIADILLDIYGEMLVGSLPPALRDWLGSGIPLSLPERERKHLVMYAVATGAGPTQRGCLSGIAADCLKALGLSGAPGNDQSGQYAGLLRVDFLLSLLELRPDTWGRLRMADGKTPLEAISRATDVSADSLARRWLKSTLTTRPPEGVVGVRMGLSALGWIALFLAGAVLGGRSRWV